MYLCTVFNLARCRRPRKLSMQCMQSRRCSLQVDIHRSSRSSRFSSSSSSNRIHTSQVCRVTRSRSFTTLRLTADGGTSVRYVDEGTSCALPCKAFFHTRLPAAAPATTCERRITARQMRQATRRHASRAESVLCNIANVGAVWLGTCSERFPVPVLPRQSAGQSVVEARIVA